MRTCFRFTQQTQNRAKRESLLLCCLPCSYNERNGRSLRALLTVGKSGPRRKGEPTMKSKSFTISLAIGSLGVWGIIHAASPSDFEIAIVPASADVAVNRSPGGTLSGSVDLSVELTTVIDGVEGWAFGIILNPGADVSMSVTRIAPGEGVMTVNDGAPPEFCRIRYYEPGDPPTTDIGNCDTTPCEDIETQVAAVAQEVIIDFARSVALPATNRFAVLDLTLWASPSDEGVQGTVEFTDSVDVPPIGTFVVWAETSFRPATIQGGTLSFVESDAVLFVSPGLKAAVACELGVTDPTPADMLGLTVLRAISSDITDLTGIEYALNLEDLSLDINQISDLSPLEALTNLEDLHLEDNPLSCHAYCEVIPRIRANNPGIGVSHDPLPGHCVCNPTVEFRRGDANTDGALNMADAIFILQHLFANGPTPTCLDAADANDAGAIDLADGIYILQNLFADGRAIPPPNGVCGMDPTPDQVECMSYEHCP